MALKSNDDRKDRAAADNANKYNVKVDRVHRFQNGDISLDMTVNGVEIKGAAYRTKKDDPDSGFISFPSRQGKDGKWYKHCFFPIYDILLADIEDQIDNLLS